MPVYSAYARSLLANRLRTRRPAPRLSRPQVFDVRRDRHEFAHRSSRAAGTEAPGQLSACPVGAGITLPVELLADGHLELQAVAIAVVSSIAR